MRIPPKDFVFDNIRDVSVSRESPEYEALRKDIEAGGVKEPVTFYYDGQGKPVLLNGHTRVAIAIELNIQEIEAVVRPEPTKAERILYQLSANHVIPLSPIDLARAFMGLSVLGMSQNDIATFVGKSPAYVSQHVSLLTLPPELQDRVARGELSYRAGYELTTLPEDALSHPSAEAVKTVREAKRLKRAVAAAPERPMPSNNERDPTPIVEGPGDEQAALAQSLFEMALETLRHAVSVAREAGLDVQGWPIQINNLFDKER